MQASEDKKRTSLSHQVQKLQASVGPTCTSIFQLSASMDVYSYSVLTFEKIK